MRLRSTALVSSCVFVLVWLGARAEAQGRFSNFETPQTHPIEIAHVGESDYVLVCNTPDNSVDIYKAVPPHAFVQRVPVGMGPATVRWNGALGRFYTCNFDGDSVSIVRLDAAGSSVNAVIERTDSLYVGDEPSDIAFDSTNTTAVVSLSSRSSVTLLKAINLQPAGGELRLIVPDPSGLELAVKMPRRIAWLPDGRFFAANLRGGSPNPALMPMQYDIGIFRHDTASPTGPDEAIGGLGSTNHSFAINSIGTLMFVVGTKAQNHDPAAIGVDAVRQLKTGFVQSWLMVVDIPAGGAMHVHDQAPINTTPTPLFPSINLNRNYSATSSSPLVEVSTDSALVQPTDVLLIENTDGVAKIVLTAFHSDRVAILTPSMSTFGGYSIQRINIPVLTPASKYSVSGPRGLAYSASNQRIFTNGRLDNTLSVINSTTGALTAQIQLPNDPTPNEIREGRQFLYSNRFSINDSASPTLTGGFVSCAVCHVDARTDGLPWDLGSTTLGPAIPSQFHDEDLPSGSPPMPNFPTEKGPLVTQTLQGLINYPLNESMQKASTNAPYHWRGDKFDFTDFNEAFVNLQGMDDVATTNGPRGISEDEMIKYRRFINTVLYPPNFEQDLFRTTTGTLGTDPNDPAQATGAKLGMMIFHDFASDFVGSGLGRSCVDCHQLPDGSSNTATETFSVNTTVSMGAAQQHPFETAALRNISQREMLLHNDFTGVAGQFTANNGLLHPGDYQFLTSFSINTIVHANFTIPGTGAAQAVNRDALTEFVRKLDTGVAPMAGFAYTVDPTLNPIDSGLNSIAFASFEGQVNEANIGLGVYTRNNGTVKGYWYDIAQTTPMYREEGTSNLITRQALLALAAGTDSAVIAQATPLGTERRWASSNGQGTLLTGTRAANFTLEKMAPNTAFVDIPKFNLALQTNPLTAPTDSSIWTLRVLQLSVAGGSFGVPAVRHEPPRRFRVTGDNIRAGAKLRLSMAAGSNPASSPVESMDMHLYPTQYVSNGRQIWETLVELDATQTFALLNGGYHAPDVDNVLKRLTTTPSLQPATWNQFQVAVQNEDASAFPSASGWQVLKIQDNR